MERRSSSEGSRGTNCLDGSVEAYLAERIGGTNWPDSNAGAQLVSK